MEIMVFKDRTSPPDCCVIIEMEEGASLGYRRAVLLNEIEALGSLKNAAKTTRIACDHARELVLQMNRSFSQPLVAFIGSPMSSDQVFLTERGKTVARSYWRQFEPVWQSIIEERSRHY